MNESDYLEGKNFSLVLGGPFFQLLNRVHLTGKALELVKLRTAIVSLTAWMPLLLLSRNGIWSLSIRLRSSSIKQSTRPFDCATRSEQRRS